MKTSKAGLDLIRASEGCRLKAYRDPVGIWTIGYGLTSAAGLISVHEGLSITQKQAEEYLRQSLLKYEAAVLRAVRVPLSQNQFDACVSLCYNIGPGAFAKSSVASYCNLKKFDLAATAFKLWTKAKGKTLPGLVKRRNFECALFQLPDSNPVVAVAPEPELIAEAPAPVPVPAPVIPANTFPPPAAPRLSIWQRVKAWFA